MEKRVSSIIYETYDINSLLYVENMIYPFFWDVLK